MLRRSALTFLGLAGLALVGCVGTTPWRGLRKIGLLQSFHGPNTEDTMATHVMVRETLIVQNQSGGIGGIRVELVSLDDEANASVFQMRLAELLADPLMRIILVRSDIPNVSFAPARIPIIRTTDSAMTRNTLIDYLKNSA